MEDTVIPAEEYQSPPKPVKPWHQRPVVLGLLAVVFLVGGWNLSSYRRPNSTLRDLERMADSDEQREQLHNFRQHSPPPYQLPGRVLLFAGVFLFAAAAVKMYRAKPGT